jgi:methyl-accepting chemotaxis protein
MKLGTKIVVAGLAAVVASVVVALTVQHHIIRQQGIELTRDNMRTLLMQAEHARETVSMLNRQHAFDQPRLLAEYKKTGDLRGSALYQTIPVVVAWKTVEQTAEQQGYEFRIPKRQARNERNNPTPDEEKILDSFENGQSKEYFQLDQANGQIVFARPIILTEDCLACHGDPKNSPTGDGKDIVGYPMENWKTGEVHGAIVLKSNLDHINQVVRAGVTHTLLWIIPVAVLICFGFYELNRRLIVAPLTGSINSLSRTSEHTTSSAEQVSASSQTLAEGASEQAASLEETSASLEELSSMTQRNAANAQKANDLTRDTRTAAERGSSDMQSMTAAMQSIKASSDDIAKIIKTIDEIAFQTNILALNAAVEAARAGESGMGFAVVAEEVRNLAQRSAQAAKETEAKIAGAISNTAHGVLLSNKVAEVLNDIVLKVRQVDELVAEVSAASREQTQGIAQINQAVSKMDQTTQSNAASAEEGAAAAEELNAQAVTLKHSVVELLQMIGQQALAPGQSEPITRASAKPGQIPPKPATLSAPARGTTVRPPAPRIPGDGKSF